MRTDPGAFHGPRGGKGMVGGSAPKNRPRTSIYGSACWRFVRFIACISNGSKATPASAKTSAVISFAPLHGNRRNLPPDQGYEGCRLYERWMLREASLVARATCCQGSLTVPSCAPFLPVATGTTVP